MECRVVTLHSLPAARESRMDMIFDVHLDATEGEVGHVQLRHILLTLTLTLQPQTEKKSFGSDKSSIYSHVDYVHVHWEVFKPQSCSPHFYSIHFHTVRRAKGGPDTAWISAS